MDFCRICNGTKRVQNQKIKTKGSLFLMDGKIKLVRKKAYIIPMVFLLIFATLTFITLYDFINAPSVGGFIGLISILLCLYISITVAKSISSNVFEIKDSMVNINNGRNKFHINEISGFEFQKNGKPFELNLAEYRDIELVFHLKSGRTKRFCISAAKNKQLGDIVNLLNCNKSPSS